MSELKSTIFKAGHFNVSKIQAILEASKLTRGAGADERLRIADLLAKEWNETFKAVGSFKEIDFEITIQNSTLKAWVVGITAGWMASDADDMKCRILRDAAKALKCWQSVSKNLPKVDDDDFESDEEVSDEIEIDGESEE